MTDTITVNVEPQDVFDEMERVGGGFVQHLGACWRRADGFNSEKLHEVFGEYYKHYEQLARERLEKERSR